MTEDIEVLKLGKLSLQKKIDNIEKYSDEIKQMDMSDDKESDERDQISENDEERLNKDIEVLQLVKLSSKKNDDNIEKEDVEITLMDMSDDKYSSEKYQIDKNDKEIVTSDIEVFKLGKFDLQKNTDNVEK